MNKIVYAGPPVPLSDTSPESRDAWDMVYCASGNCALVLNAGTLEYEPGSTAAVPPGTPHRWAVSRGAKCLCVHMLSPTLPFKEPTVIAERDAHFLLDAFAAAAFHFHSELPQKTALLSAYGSLISSYLTAYHSSPAHSRVVEMIEQHILAHYADSSYELMDYLHSLPFNYDYLRKLFQREMNLTPHQYLMNKRLDAAAEALLNAGSNGVSMADIARQCGFREALYFSRMFKKHHGVSPSFYAQRIRNGPEQDTV